MLVSIKYPKPSVFQLFWSLVLLHSFALCAYADFSIITYNIHGGYGPAGEGTPNSNLTAFRNNYMNDEDVICLQEVDNGDCWTAVQAVFSEYPYQYRTINETTKSIWSTSQTSIAILSKYPFETTNSQLIQTDPGGDKWERHAQYVTIKIGENTVHIFHFHNTYNWGQDNGWWSEIEGLEAFRDDYVFNQLKITDLTQADRLVMLGDFNLLYANVDAILPTTDHKYNGRDHISSMQYHSQDGHYATVAAKLSDHPAVWATMDLLGPNPDPMTWASAPAATTAGTIIMEATAASDSNGVEYQFTNTTIGDGSHDSGWQDSTVYIDSGLTEGVTYSYTVMARDKSGNGNITGASASSSATPTLQYLTLPFKDSFENGAANWAQAVDDDFDWTVHSGGTETAAAGPDGASEGSYYLYAEGHHGLGSNKTAAVQCSFDFSSATAPELRFDYHMYGAYIDYLSVDVYDGSTWTNDVWTRSGQQHSSSADPWSTGIVDLAGFAGMSEVTVRFRTANGVWNAADPAIDNVLLTEEPISEGVVYYNHSAGSTTPTFVLEGITSSSALGGNLSGGEIATTIDQLSAAVSTGLSSNIASDNFDYFFAYTVHSGGANIAYTRLVLDAYAKDANRRYQISYTIAGGSEVFITNGQVESGDFDDVGNFDTYDFPDFTTSSDVEFRIYWQGSAASTALARVYVDDFILFGSVPLTMATDVLAGYDFDDGTNTPTTAVTLKDTNVTASDYDTGSGLNTLVNSGNDNSLGEVMDAEGNSFGTSNLHSFGGARDPFGFTDMNDVDNLELAITNEDYMVFTITPDSGYQLDLSRFTFRTFAKTQDHAAERWALFSSVDGFTLGKHIEIGQTTTEATYVNNVVDLSAAKFQGLTDAVTFRLYIYGGNQSYSAATLFDKVIVHGSATEISLLTAQEVWRQEHFGFIENTGDAADVANPDFDSLNNFLEFVLDTDPTVFDSPYQSMTPSEIAMLIEYKRRKSTGYSIHAEWSPNLQPGSWDTVGITEEVATDDGEIETILVTVPFGPNPDQKFVRIVVE